ncbi:MULTISPECIES: succinylglutamate desuccinylase/aspartoacylase family protein [Cellvibrio]|uniref:Deacylase n=1 Tax=Cellvibrio fibrivorans TaxID=126350 RepID=A0ABU1UWW0_9GAMM|nr:succinylglutamate desuccinylase/aspartoacylase family protein [Cellvibrio fibrivorans]MDR7089671.1 putative deacylase [Cellvibrio fibrivorans]
MRLTWNSETAVGGFSEATPILVVNGATPGKTLCLTGAVHGDELNGIEMVRRVVFDIDPAKLTGTIIGVPVANIMGFRRNSRYLPDRRDWNRYFPGNTHGSSASRLAHSFFTKIIMHCDSLVDLHTGSFHRTNLPQLRADLADENVARLAQNFGVIAVLNGRGNPNSLRAAAVRAGIPAVTLEAGEPMAMQSEVVEEGVKAINTLLAKTGMYGKQQRWTRIAPVYYRSAWVRANQSGILFSKATLGQRVKEEDILGTVTDPITNARTTIKSPYNGRIIGMALDQVVLPGFAAYHIGIQTPEAILIEESQMNEGVLEEDEEDGDDSGVDSSDEIDEPETGVSKAQDRMADE